MRKTIETLDGDRIIHTVNGVDTTTAAVLTTAIRQYTPLDNGINKALGDDILSVINSEHRLWNQGSWRQVWILAGEEDTSESEQLEFTRAISSLTSDPEPSCGTALCFAGWSGELTAANWVIDKKDVIDLGIHKAAGAQQQSEEWVAVTTEEYEVWRPKICCSANFNSPRWCDSLPERYQERLQARGFSDETHTLVHIEEYACMQLGLTHGDIYNLFEYRNTREILERVWAAYVEHGPNPTVGGYIASLGKGDREWASESRTRYITDLGFLKNYLDDGTHSNCIDVLETREKHEAVTV